MMQIVVIGLGAGAAAALLFASVVSGSMAAVFLFYLAPLPILIAALGWSHWAGLIAAASAALAIGTLSGSFFISVSVIAFGAWWLGYLALLARPVGNGGGEAMEWYPVGRLVLWAAVIGTLVVAAAIPNFGTDQQSLQAGLRKVYERILRDPAVVDMLVIAVPPAAAVFSTLTNVFNLWLAGRIVKVSGRLKRPWPDLALMTLPTSSMVALAAAIAGSFLPDLIGVLAGVLAASLLMAFALLGFAVLHAITRGLGSRAILLTGAYAAAIVFFWPLLAIAMLGLSENAFNIRARVLAKRGPPTLPT
ncbi:MAG: DUF2232 domain-containing protein [Xanthobacteraceae bacterium]|jgi:hypothetical protein